MKTLRYVCLFAALLIHGMALENQENLQLASFDKVWTTIHDSHWDKEKVGAAWDQARSRLRPEAERAHSAEEVRPVIGKLLKTLGESHFTLIPADVYASMRNGEPAVQAEPDFDFRILDGEAVVTRAAGDVQAGWLIRRIDQEEVSPLLAKVRTQYPNERESRLIEYLVLRERMSDASGKTKRMTFVTSRGEEKNVELPLSTPRHLVEFPNLPPLGMQIEWNRTAAVGYLRFNVFFDPTWLQQELAHAAQDCAHCEGFILDLRGNIGGIAGLAAGTAGWFLPQQTVLGTIIAKTGEMKLTAFPRPERYAGKLAVLVDEVTLSTAEILAAGLQDAHRARVFGEVTQGMALPSFVEKLPNGDRLEYAFADYISASGAAIEGTGVRPDVTVRPNRNDYLQGRDPALDAARQWIHSKE